MFKVTVIIPIYNREKFIERSVKSALELSQVGEILLIDDGSSDNSFAVCQELTHQNPKVKLLTHPNKANRGVSASRNLGIAHANFEFISFLDSDDYFQSHRFKKDEFVFMNNEEVNVSYSLSQVLSEDGETRLYGSFENTTKLFSKDQFYELSLKKEMILGHISSVTFRKSLFKKLNIWFDERLSIHEDTELWIRIARITFFYPSELENPVSIYFQHRLNTISLRSKISEVKFIVVLIDNIGLKNLFEFEKIHLIYKLSRVYTNPIKNNVVRKSLLHGIQLLINPFKDFFLSRFYVWGKRSFNLKQ